MAETGYDVIEASHDVVAGIVREYIDTGCALADTGAPDGLDSATWSKAIYQLRWGHLAEANLPASKIIEAMRLLGWTPPAVPGGEN